MPVAVARRMLVLILVVAGVTAAVVFLVRVVSSSTTVGVALAGLVAVVALWRFFAVLFVAKTDSQ